MTTLSQKSKMQRLKKELHLLQINGTTVWEDFRRSNKAFYKHIAEIYFWWLKAKEIEGYLEGEYVKLNRRFKRRISTGINFAPVLTLTWGNNSCSDDDLNRHSRALNKINEEYLKRKKYYAKDGVIKIAAYIEANNGINGLTGYGTKTAENEDEERITLKKQTATEKQKQDALLISAISHYSTTTLAPLFHFNTHLPITDNKLSVVLVRQTASGYELLGATNDRQVVEAAAIINFKHKFSAIRPSVRALIELLRTQSLPAHLQKLQRDLVDKSAQKNSDGKNMLSMRRVIYRADTKDFLLSPIRADAGVVSVAKLKLGGLEEIAGDAFLSTYARVALERLAISTYEFNLYVAEQDNEIAKYQPESSASHVIRLQSLASELDYLNLDFWQYDNVDHKPVPQVDIDLLIDADWTYTTTNSWFRELSLNIVKPWLLSHGKHIKRKHQMICKLEFTSTEIKFSFVQGETNFDHTHLVYLSQPAITNVNLNLLFLTKDLMPVLSSIADFEVIGDIKMAVDMSKIIFEFETSAAAFHLAVPTVNQRAVRSTSSFTKYIPTTKSSLRVEDTEEEFDYEAEAAQIASEQKKVTGSLFNENYAIYLPAVNDSFSADVLKPLTPDRPFPSNIDLEDLIFWNKKNKLWHYGHILHSVGLHKVGSTPDNAVTRAGRTDCFLLGDSGGFQIGTGGLKGYEKLKKGMRGDDAVAAWASAYSVRSWILEWLELHTDYAMTIDMPLWAKLEKRNDTPFHKCTIDQLTQMTVENLRFIDANRQGRTKWLNVIQGLDSKTTEDWWKAVKWFDCGGYALAGAAGIAGGIKGLLTTVLMTRDDGALFEGKNWIHTLGVSTTKWAILLTAIQKALRKTVNTKIQISFDSSTPFQEAGIRENAIIQPAFSRKPADWNMKFKKVRQSALLTGSTESVNFSSPLADKLTLGHLNVRGGPWTERSFDTVSNLLLCNHNCYALLEAFKSANEIAFDSNRDLLPAHWAECLDFIDELFAESNWRLRLEQESKLLNLVAAST